MRSKPKKPPRRHGAKRPANGARKHRRNGAATKVAKSNGAGLGAGAEKQRMRELLRKLAKVVPGLTGVAHGDEYRAAGAEAMSVNQRHVAMLWWVDLLRRIREALGLKFTDVAKSSGLKWQAVYYIEGKKRSPRQDSMLRIADAIEVRFSAMALTVELWQSGHRVPFVRVLRAVDALWEKLRRPTPAVCGIGGG